MSTVAGHKFPMSDLCECGIHWLHIQDCDDGCIGRPGWAHVGNLNLSELGEIRVEKARRARAFDNAMGYIGR